MTGELVLPCLEATSATATMHGVRWIKRLFDIVAVLTGGIVILPVLLLVGLIIGTDSL